MKEHFRMVRLNLFYIAVLCCSALVCFGQSSSETVKIPSQLLTQLIHDDSEVRMALRDGYDPDNNPAQQFFVELVDLNNDKKPEYFVSQTGGNSSAPIWIYRRTRNGYQQILKAAFMGFRVLSTSANRFHDLELSYGGSAMGYEMLVYKFNGRRYVLATSKHTKGNHAHAPAQRIRHSPRVLEGIVVDTTGGPQWIGIVVESNSKRYVVSINNSRYPRLDPKVVGGNVESIGTRVRIKYTNAAPWINDTIVLTPTEIIKIEEPLLTPKRSLTPQARIRNSNSRQDDDFRSFYANFKRAVLANDRAAIRAMMLPNFMWALIERISRDQALRRMDEWKYWRKFKNAVAVSRPVRCKQPYCGFGDPVFFYSGYRVGDRRLGDLLFTRDSNGDWKWSGLLGD